MVVVRSVLVRRIHGALRVSCNKCLRLVGRIRTTRPSRTSKRFSGVNWILSAGRVVKVSVKQPRRIGRFLLLSAKRRKGRLRLVYKESGCLNSRGAQRRCPSGTKAVPPASPVPVIPPQTPTRPISYNTAVGRFDSVGNLTTLGKLSLNSGWTDIRAEPGNGLQLFYDKNTGTAASVAFDALGQPRTMWSGVISAGWTAIAQTANNLMLFYNADTGMTAAGLFDGSGKLRTLQSYPLNRGWSTVTALAGGVVLFYNAANGIAGVGTIDASGSYHQVGSQTLAAGWRIVTRVANGLEFFYNPSGASAVARWNGSTIQTINTYTIESGWTSIVPITNSREAFYSSTSGRIAIGAFDGSGNLATTTSYSINRGWNILAGLATGLELFYAR